MIKIIKGKTYNTSTARLIARYENMENQSDFNYWKEELYKKENGDFFIYGEGGAMTRYAELQYGSRSCGHDIQAISEEQAKIWMEDHATAEEYIAVFGLPEE